MIPPSPPDTSPVAAMVISVTLLLSPMAATIALLITAVTPVTSTLIRPRPWLMAETPVLPPKMSPVASIEISPRPSALMPIALVPVTLPATTEIDPVPAEAVIIPCSPPVTSPFALIEMALALALFWLTTPMPNLVAPDTFVAMILIAPSPSVAA